MRTSFNLFVEREVPRGELIVSRTDLKGTITYVNDTFADISGYEAHELIGMNHSIIRHPDMPKSVFVDLWSSVKRGKIWQGDVKNLRKDGGYYWVHATISGLFKNNKLVEYKSVREPIEKRQQLKMQAVYDKLRFEEEHQSRVVLYIDNSKLEEAKSLEK